ncbi:MAG: hypothetical protein AB8F94_04690 [Saprospiraceae bacterium]
MRLASLMLLTLLLCFSCGKDDSDPEKEGNCLTATIDGDDFTAESTTATFITTNIEYENLGIQETRLLTITGTIPSLTGNTETITLAFACSEFSSDLDYVDSDSDCGIAMSYNITSFTDPNSSLVISSSTGAINVEEVTDEKIRGTFTFNGEDQNGGAYVITNGFFDTTIEQ